MQKAHNLALFVLLVSAFVVLTSTVIAQEIANEKQSPKTKTDIDILQTYKEISALPMNANMPERRALFLKLPSVEKSEIFKLHLAMQLVKRPNLNQEQKDVILEAISMITPESYADNIEKRSIAQQKTTSLQQTSSLVFSKKEVFEIFASLGGDNTDIQLLEKYQQITAPIYQNERRGEFSKASAQEKSNIVRLHFASQIAKRFLNREQLNFISEAISIVSPEFYSAVKGTPEWAKNKVIQESAKERTLNFFSKEDAFNIFASLGGKSCAERKNTKSNTSNSEDPIEESKENCGCHYADDWCGTWSGGTKRCHIGGCETTLFGCGYGMWNECDGLCKP
ncbi:MAG TPA: bacteriocin fulvocin C-related protein [Pyrinomonadaceae bacterium]|jgi:hypothetical protein